MVVKLTQEQADYLETFEGRKKEAIYYISRWGFNYKLEDGLGKVYENKEEKPFEIFEKMKMVESIINGYEVIISKFKFHTFSDITNLSRLYYAGKNVQLTANYKEAETVEKNSEEYFVLENLGFYKEEV